MIRLVLLFAILVAGHVLQLQLAGQDVWTRFRGPNGSGVNEEASLPIEFGPDRNLVWKTPLPSGHSSPVLFEDRIFITASEEDQLLTICLDRQSGKELWRRRSHRDRREKLDPRNHPAAASPVVNASGVCVFFADFGLLSYTHDGELRWSRPLGPFDNIYGMGASPVLVGNLIVLVCDQSTSSFIAAFNNDTGEQVWRTGRPEATSGHCTPIIYQGANGGPQIIVPGSFLLTAYNAQSGDKLWWVGGLCFEMKSTPVMNSDTVFINGYGSPANQPGKEVDVQPFASVLAAHDADGDKLMAVEEMPTRLGKNFFPALDLDGNGTMDASEWSYYRAAMATKNSMMAIKLGGSGEMTETNVAWKYHRNIPQLPSPILYGGLLFMISDSGIMTCFDPQSGEMRSRGRLIGAEGNVYASPVAADGKLYYATESGKVAVTRADDSLQVLAVNDLGERCYATPAIADDKIYVRTTEALYCFGEAAR